MPSITTYIGMRNLIKIYPVVQELAFSLTANGRTERRTHTQYDAPRSLVTALHTSGLTKLNKYQ